MHMCPLLSFVWAVFRYRAMRICVYLLAKIDLLYARLPLQSLAGNLDLMDDNLLGHMDEKSVLALNGWRCAEYILRHVQNSDGFRMALRAIKLWAKRMTRFVHSQRAYHPGRHLYSNMLGLLGGISWSLLVARVRFLLHVTSSSLCRSYYLAPRQTPLRW